MERDPITMLVARNIQVLMDQVGMDAAKLGRAAGLNHTGIYDILKGKSRNPRLDTITKIAAALGVPVSLLFEEKGDDDLKTEIIALVSAMPPDDRVRARSVIRALADAQVNPAQEGPKEPPTE